MVESLHDAHQDILKMIAETPDINAHQMTLELERKSAAVTRSVQLLEERGFVRVEKTKGVSKLLYLTDKGGWYSIKCGADYQKTFAKHPYLLTESSHKILRDLQALKLDELYITVFTDMVVNNNLFNKNGDSIFTPEKLGGFRYNNYVKTFWINLTYQTKEKAPDKLKSLLQFCKTLKVIPDQEIKILQVELNAS